jgi:soluble lytic murein transglycosylase
MPIRPHSYAFLQKSVLAVLLVLPFGFGGAAVKASSVGFTYQVDAPSAQAVARAKQAFDAKQWGSLPGLAQQAQGDVLAVYADYWVAERAVWAAPSVLDVPVAQAFLDKYPGTYMADKLKATWVLAAAQAGAFHKIQSLGEFTWFNKQVRCAKLEAFHMASGQRATAKEALEDFAPGDACWSMLRQFVADGVLSRTDVLPLMKEAIERNHTRTADRLATFALDRASLSRYQAMMQSPGQWVRNYQGQASGDDAWVVAFALARMARENLSSTAQYVEQSWAKRLPAEPLGWVWAQMALRSALNLESRAHAWYRRAGNVQLTDNNHEWRVRAALRQPAIDWVWVSQAIDWMPPALQADTSWQYWKARGLQSQGQIDQANAIYQSISPSLSFYGQLALEELGQKITAPAQPPAVTAKELAQATSNPHLQEAIALFRQGWRSEAVPQWNFAIRGMTDRQLMAAAELAREQRIYDRVVNTSERTQDAVDFSQRFIAPFEGQVMAQAQSINVDPAWVYGLIRQESRFIMDARSVVGASGLMQLMPATAKYVANKIGMTDFRPSSVNDFDVNTKLGTHYLRMVLNDLGGSQVLASAGYNAGPGRPVRWRSTLTHPVEGAIFAETIPFNETRDYVKSVLSNATYYAAMFSGQPQSLKERLGHIEPRKQ